MDIKKYIRIKDKNIFYLMLTILVFLILKIFSMGFKFSDENIYFYMANLITHGQLPYKDFFFASPPIQLMIISAVLLLVGSKILLLKLIPIIAVSITSMIIFLYVKKKFNSDYGVFASILYLFSFVVLTTTDHSTGVHLTILFFMISFYLIEKEKYFIGGIFSAIALLTRLYVAFAIIGLGIYLLIKNWKKAINYGLGIASIFIPVNIILILLFKQSYLTSVFSYHLAGIHGLSKFNVFKFFILWDFIPIILTISSLFSKVRQKLSPVLITGGIICLFYIFYTDIYYLYLGILIPFLAIPTGVMFGKIAGNKEQLKKLVLIFLIILLIFNSVFYIKNHANTAKIKFVGDIVTYIKQNSLKNETIYGSFEITPLVALLSERKITNNYIDTNEKTFLSGIYNITNRTNSLRGNVRFIIMKDLVNQNGIILSSEPIIKKDFLENECKKVKTYSIKKDYKDNIVIVYDCL